MSRKLTLALILCGLGLICVRYGASLGQAHADPVPVPAQKCLVTYKMYERLALGTAEYDMFGDCQDTGELTYDAAHGKTPWGMRDRIWRFQGENGRVAIIHTWKGEVIEKLWQ